MVLRALCLQFVFLTVGVVWAEETLAETPAARVQWSADATDPEFNLELPLTFRGLGDESQVTVRFDEQENGDRLELRVTATELTLWRVIAEQMAPATEPVPLAFGEAGTHKITLRRRLDRVSVLVGPRCLATLWQDAAPGRVSLLATRGVIEPEEICYQPYASPEFSDDFMRGQEDATGEWEVLEGTWENTALIESVDYAPRAANSFAFAAHPQPRAIAVTGPSFWDDMHCNVAVRLSGSGQVGLGFRVQDAANYYALIFQVRSAESEGEARLLLVKVVGGQEEPLAATRRHIPPGQWHKLAATVCEDRLEAFFDDAPILSARDDAFSQGGVALIAADCDTAYFDDANVQPYKGFFDDFEGEKLGRWHAISGQWRVAAGERNRHLVPASKGAAFVVAGRSDWADYELQADILPTKGAAGLCFYWLSPTDYFLWRATRGRQQLVRVTETGEEVLDDAPLPKTNNAWLRVKVRAGNDYATAWVNGKGPLEALLPAGSSGRVGLYSDKGAGCAFDNVRVSFPPGYVPPVLPETMLTDAEMKEQFANPAESWFSITDETHRPQAVGMNWNKGEYFDPMDVTFPLSLAGSEAGKVTVRIEGDQTTGEGGYELVIARAANSTGLVFTLSRLGEPLGQASYQIGDTGMCRVRFGKRGAFVVVYVDEELLMSYRDRLPLAGSTAEGLQAGGRSR